MGCMSSTVLQQAVRCRELEIPNSKRSSLKQWRLSDSPATTVLRRCFFWRSPYVAIFYHFLVATACHCPMYFSKVWLHQWPRWISSSEGVSAHRVVGDSPLRLPHGQSGKWHGCSFKLKGSLLDSPLVTSVKAIKQPRFYDNEKGLCFKLWNYCTILHLFHKVPLEPIHYKGATACHREASSPSSGRCWRAPRPSEATRPPWWTSAPRPLPPTSCTLAFKRWGNVGNMI